MSFILDALKKSENERQRQIGPSLADIPMRRAKSERPWWAVAVAALLVVNLGVLVVVLTRNGKSDAPAPVQPAPVQQAPQPQQRTSAPPPQQRPAPQPAMGAPTRVDPSVRSLADEAGADAELLPADPSIDPAIVAAATVPAGPPAVRSITPPSVAPLSNQGPNQSTFASLTREPAQEEMLPTNSSLIAGGTSLPDMKLDIHVYSTSPAERFVFVNMRKYVEGQSLSEGPMLERITPDGAVLNQRGLRFLLPRQ